MSRKMFKVLVLGAMLVSALASASSASAANWTNNGASPFTATAPAAKLTIASPSGLGTLCLTNSGTGALAASPGPAYPGTWTGAASVTPIFTNCTLGGSPAAVNCTAASLNAVSQTGASQTNGNLSSISCKIAGGGCGAFSAGPPRTVTTAGITVTGTVQSTYDNGTHLLTVLAAGQSLTASSLASAGCDTLTGWVSGPRVWSATFGSNTTPIGNLIYTVTAPTSPFPSISHT
jgi:hypothetical protein